MNGNSTRKVGVERSGSGVVAHVGLHALDSFADRLCLGDDLWARVPWTGERAPGHDRGKVLTQTMLMLAGGGEACTDIEALAAVLRPGNAGANTVVDHLTVLDTAIGQLPDTVGVGHHRGDDPELVARPVVVRADSAGCTHGFVWGCRARNVGFAVAARSNASVHAAISRVACIPNAWTPTITQAGERRDGAVCDVTDHIDLSDWPSGTRLIIRRSRRHTVHITDRWPWADEIVTTHQRINALA